MTTTASDIENPDMTYQVVPDKTQDSATINNTDQPTTKSSTPVFSEGENYLEEKMKERRQIVDGVENVYLKFFSPILLLYLNQ